MERFEDKNFRIWYFYDAIDVVCPYCSKKAVVKENKRECPKCGQTDCFNSKNRVFECNHCYHEMTEKRVLYQMYAKVYCSECSERYEMTSGKTVKKADAIKAECPYCKHKEVVKAKVSVLEVDSDENPGLVKDPFFNCVLWYQERFKNDVFWVLNQEHMLYLEQYVSADLRERNAKYNSGLTMVARLPNFIKVAKNRQHILKSIKKWTLSYK
jgi:DNA-directed RNA polymerase subunit RPC12/RpoP